MRLSGCDGLDEARYQVIPITTIVQPLEEMCDVAWEMLQMRIDGSKAPTRTVEMTAALEIRASTLSSA